jgi:type I restriction enzyme, S subunit
VTAPSDWAEHRLGDLYNLSNGINADKSAYSRGVPFANVLEVISNESLNESDIPGRVSLPKKTLDRYRVTHGDVLFNRTSETQEEVGLSSVYLGDAPVVFGGFVFRGRPKTADFDTGYSKYALRAAPVRAQITARGQGGIRANVGQRDLKSVRLYLPGLPEQRSIAVAIDEVSRLAAKLEHLVAKEQAIKQGMMQQLLTGRTRLPGFAGDWEPTKLGAVARMNSGGTPLSSVSRYYGGGVPWVSISDMTRAGKYIAKTENTLTEEGLASSAAKLYEPDVVLYAMYASLGECSLAVGRVTSSQAILGIKTGPRLDREFLYYWLQHLKPRVKLLGQQGTQANLNAGIVRDFGLELPPVEEQAAIASALADADGGNSALERRLEKARAIKTGMMQQLLTGRVRLPVEAAP